MQNLNKPQKIRNPIIQNCTNQLSKVLHGNLMNDTQPDISYAVHKLGQDCSQTGNFHWSMIMYVLWYLCVTSKFGLLELISLEVSQNIYAKSSHLVCWYLPPTAGAYEFVFENLREISKDLDRVGKEIILIGDTNCDLRCSKKANAKQLKLIYSEYHLEQLIKSYTRVAVTTTESSQ